jgi:hypothetical protein
LAANTPNYLFVTISPPHSLFARGDEMAAVFQISKQNSIAEREKKRNWFRQIVPAFLWITFTTGLLIQVFAPQLNVENHAFVMRQALTSQSKEVDPAAMVERERGLQWASGFLTAGGAISLAFWYRRRLADAMMPPRIIHPRSQ